MAFLWQDNAEVGMLLTIHSDKNVEFRERRCPQKSSTTANRIARQRFQTLVQDQVQSGRVSKARNRPVYETTWCQILPIPKLVDDYNNYMNGIDVADQLRRNYKTQQVSLRNWFPFFYWLPDVSLVNAQLYTFGQRDLLRGQATSNSAS